ncbi:hypothetical protein WN51_04103 [Melipona quadrifasciata]|uniref:Uncharacterized protein n=1 Tax=Melipona quadrifasciata TaxID=166423 RepID=A0A0M8ZQ32_9HYME|nr:hypothetical protein WN51_04103 [Melipona quadrifasciata]
MKKRSVKDQGKPDRTDARDDDKDIRDKMKKIDVKSPSSTNSSSSTAKNSALLPSGVARVKQQEAGRINQAGSSSPSGSATGELIHVLVLLTDKHLSLAFCRLFSYLEDSFSLIRDFFSFFQKI